MTALVVGEHRGGGLSEATARTVTAARQLSETVHVLIAGTGCAEAAVAAAQLEGVARVLVADHPLYGHALAEPLAALIVPLAEDYDVLLAPASFHGKALMPRVAALLDVAQISDITGVVAPDIYERPVYAGAVLQTVQAPPGKRVLTVRPSAFAPAPLGGTAAIQSLPAGPNPQLSIFEGRAAPSAERPELTTAKIVIAGGRGVQTSSNFKLLEQIADRLNAAVGASRAAVDAGFAGNEIQVGQTGKAVAPALYIAAGISGAIQHLAGMKESGIVAAINKDEDAPIFGAADIGLVADLFEALPELDAELARRGYSGTPGDTRPAGRPLQRG